MSEYQMNCERLTDFLCIFSDQRMRALRRGFYTTKTRIECITWSAFTEVFYLGGSDLSVLLIFTRNIPYPVNFYLKYPVSHWILP